MKKIESMRDALSSWPSYEYVKNHEAAGWRLAAVEWQREIDGDAAMEEMPAARGLMEEIPYGTRIAADCLHLQENPTEMQILNHLAEMVVQDLSYARMAESLNQRGFHTRDGKSLDFARGFQAHPAPDRSGAPDLVRQRMGIAKAPTEPRGLEFLTRLLLQNGGE